jgi:Glycosyl hydrolase family 63 C-terminal domain
LKLLGYSELQAAAASVLRANDAGGYTLPSRATYPHQWNWDSALIALGWAELDPARAWTELETLAAARDEQGMIPHIAFRSRVVPRLTERYLPGPRWWGKRLGADRRRISGITQPPLAASCMRLVFERHPDERRARALLGAFHGWHRFLLDVRDPDGRGEPVLIHPWESGRDNAVEWDGPLWRVIPEVVVVRRRDTDSVEAAERPSLEHYRRFLTLVRQGSAAGWDQRRLAEHGSFRVLDAGFSAILARACADLAHLAEQLGEPRIADESRAAGHAVAAALRARADPDGLIRPLDAVDGSPLAVTSAGSALALLCPDLGDKQIAATRAAVLNGSLASRYGVRSLDAHHPERSARNYWRGPVWANITWLTAHALGLHGEQRASEELRGRMLKAIEGGGMREYFAPESGRGLGARDFGWTAALCLHELAAGAGGLALAA